MLPIYICEDNKPQLDYFTSIVNKTIIIENMDMEVISSTVNPLELLSAVNGKIAGIYFLDIELNASINGIILAERIREIDPHGFIVFVTTHTEMCQLIFKHKIEAMDFIVKEQVYELPERIQHCLLTANLRHNNESYEESTKFVIETKDKVISLSFDEILFFQTSTQIHKIVAHTEKRLIEFYAKMKDVESKLDDRFYRCDKSYIVNKEKIQEIDKINRVIYMTNGEKCFASVRLLKNLINNM